MLSKQDVNELLSEFLEYSDFKKHFNNNKLVTVYVSGSIMEGFGNEESDIDVFVISNSDIKQNVIDYAESNKEFTLYIKPEKLIISTLYNNINIDFEFYNYRYIENYIQEINSGIAEYHENKFDLIHRMKYGFSVIGKEKFNSMLNSINFNNYNLIQTKIVNDYYIVKSKDIKGAIQEQQYPTAYYMSLDLLQNCVSAYLSLYGETNPNNKWIFKKINRYQKNNEVDIDLKGIVYNAYSNIDLYDEESTKKKTIQILKNCQKINSLIEKRKANVY
ncbi:nucleotidyltransferase domain-containing protein [Staphylococcus kloosii]|uniref:nucleotidyltransferase domain-containing protein n=1 Tax=Staphylococcus kloosii TaxID=29384 RepID=UPI0028A35116|nr:nucleotidyltransferase domain-containing protein [Staphylococcus kloosii]MDT3959787.1 nucleotidyltransferase domain-containing protein [Staphylococcus kloosii]